MKVRGQLSDLSMDYKTKMTKATFLLECGADVLERVAEKNDLSLDIKPYSPNRSLDQNNYMWSLLQSISDVLQNGSTRWSEYLRCLQEYGIFCYLPAQEHDIKMLMSVFRVVVDRGEIEITTPSGKKVVCHQMQCFKGTSLYSQKEMSNFLEHIIDEAKQLGIDTDTPDEIEKMKGLTA